MDETLLSTGDVARRLNVSSEFVRKLVRFGKLAATRTVGGKRIFKSRDVERLAAEREQQKRERPLSAALR
jgi:excisionase family DNA binding protein